MAAIPHRQTMGSPFEQRLGRRQCLEEKLLVEPDMVADVIKNLGLVKSLIEV